MTIMYLLAENVGTCCSPPQIDKMIHSFRHLERLLSRCPACYLNALNLLCHMTCSPTQKDFMNASQTAEAHNETTVEAVTYFVDQDSAAVLYQTCKDVRYRDERAINILSGKDTVDAMEFLHGLGNLIMPVPVNFRMESTTLVTYRNQTFHPLEIRPRKCSSSCICKDCKDVCPRRYVRNYACTLYLSQAIVVQMPLLYKYLCLSLAELSRWSPINNID